jgi:hypothetical protein
MCEYKRKVGDISICLISAYGYEKSNNPERKEKYEHLDRRAKECPHYNIGVLLFIEAPNNPQKRLFVDGCNEPDEKKL